MNNQKVVELAQKVWCAAGGAVYIGPSIGLLTEFAALVEHELRGGAGPVSSHATSVVRQPLTDEQIDALILQESGTGTIRDLVRIIEAAHGIGGNDD